MPHALINARERIAYVFQVNWRLEKASLLSPEQDNITYHLKEEFSQSILSIFTFNI